MDFCWEAIPASAISERTARAAQQSLLAPWKSPLEILPYRFKYRFRCSISGCGGHNMACVDWEAGQAFRRFREDYGERQALVKMKEKFLDQMCGSSNILILLHGQRLRETQRLPDSRSVLAAAGCYRWVTPRL